MMQSSGLESLDPKKKKPNLIYSVVFLEPFLLHKQHSCDQTNQKRSALETMRGENKNNIK